MAETTEPKKKANPDYLASAVNLTNPLDVMEKLLNYQARQAELQALQEKADASIPQELRDQIAHLTDAIAADRFVLTQAIDAAGSYQNVNAGWYAVKQRKVSKSYKVEPFEKTYPQFVPLVIVKAVDTARLAVLIKGGLLDEARLEADGILTISESFAYVIR